MKIKSLLLGALVSILPCVAIAAGNTYVGTSLSVQRVTASPSTFTGWRPGLFIGYGATLPECYYLGGEFLASWASTISNSYVNRDQNLRMSPALSLSLIPGMLFTESTMGYLRFGFGAANQVVNNNWLSNFVLGAGMEYVLTPAWNIRFEYDYTLFKSTAGVNPQGQELMLSLKYIYDV